MKDCILIGNSSSVLEKNLEQQINSLNEQRRTGQAPTGSEPIKQG